MGTTVSVRIDLETKKRLEALAKASGRTKSFLAAEAIAAYVDTESWQVEEIRTGLKELDAGRSASHDRVSRWLRSWGKKGEQKALRG